MIRWTVMGARVISEALKVTALVLLEWLGWSERSLYRAAIFLYLLLKVHLTMAPEVLSGWGTLELYAAGAALYVQVFIEPTAASLLVASPLLYLSSLYLQAAQTTLTLSSSLILAGGLCAYMLLALLELAEKGRVELSSEERVYKVDDPHIPYEPLSLLRALSPESLTLCGWVALSPLVVLSAAPSVSLSQAQRFDVSFPYLLFLLISFGATLGAPSAHDEHTSPVELRRALQWAFVSSLALCVLLSVLYLS